jgi:hypothetical protein
VKLQIIIYGLNIASRFCNLLARVYKEGPFVFGAQPLDVNLLSCCWHANKYCFPKSLGVLFPCLNILQHFWGLSLGFRDGVFHLLVSGLVIPSLLGGSSPPGTSGPVDLTEGVTLPGALVGRVSVAQRNLEKAWKPIGSPACQTRRNPGSNNRPAFGRQNGSLMTSQRHPSSPICSEIMSLRLREQGGNV